MAFRISRTSKPLSPFPCCYVRLSIPSLVSEAARRGVDPTCCPRIHRQSDFESFRPSCNCRTIALRPCLPCVLGGAPPLLKMESGGEGEKIRCALATQDPGQENRQHRCHAKVSRSGCGDWESRPSFETSRRFVAGFKYGYVGGIINDLLDEAGVDTARLSVLWSTDKVSDRFCYCHSH